MKRIQAIILVLALLVGSVALISCDSTPSDVVIGADELFPNINKPPVTPPDSGNEGEEGGENEEPPAENDASGGIGNNEAVDLPFVPV